MRRIQVKKKPFSHFLGSPLPFIAPAIIYVFAITIYPLFYGVYISLTDLRYDKLSSSFVGFANYIKLLNWEPFGIVLINSLVFTVGTVGLSIFFGMIIALVLNKIRFFKTLFRAISVLPWVLPSVVVGVVFSLLFSSSKLGPLNALLVSLGGEQVSWLTNPALAMIAMILAFTWRTLAFATVVFLAGLQMVPTDLIETAEIEGCNRFQVFRYAMLPVISPQVIIVLIMLTAGALNQIDVVISVTGGGPGRATETIAMSVYREGFQFLDASFAATLSVVLLVLNLVLTLIYFYGLREKGGSTVD